MAEKREFQTAKTKPVEVKYLKIESDDKPTAYKVVYSEGKESELFTEEEFKAKFDAE